MQSVTVQQARKDIGRLLDAVIGGDQIIITSRNKLVANRSTKTGGYFIAVYEKYMLCPHMFTRNLNK